jgi:hypothetical protein
MDDHDPQRRIAEPQPRWHRRDAPVGAASTLLRVDGLLLLLAQAQHPAPETTAAAPVPTAPTGRTWWCQPHPRVSRSLHSRASGEATASVADPQTGSDDWRQRNQADNRTGEHAVRLEGS